MQAESEELEGLRALPRRLVAYADDDRRTIERELHDGIHQHLVALAVEMQLAAQAIDSDPAAAGARLEELRRSVQHALDETALLSARVYPATLEAGGLAVLLRSAASKAGGRASVDVAAGPDVPAEVAMTVYLYWLDALAQVGGETHPTIEVRQTDNALKFELVAAAAGSEARLDRLHDRVAALGGRVTATPGPAGAVNVSGSLPLG